MNQSRAWYFLWLKALGFSLSVQLSLLFKDHYCILVKYIFKVNWEKQPVEKTQQEHAHFLLFFHCILSHQSPVFISGFGYISICNHFGSISCLHSCLIQLEAEHIKYYQLGNLLQGILCSLLTTTFHSRHLPEQRGAEVLS